MSPIGPDNMARPSQETATKGKSRKTDVNTAPIRKRRKRTVVSGAPDDCFACAKRGARCDRRRPYCSQCLEMGRECSGYKTTLTWGVGVASRGKLRGQKLPVMETEPETSAAGTGRTQRGAATNSQSPPSSHIPPNPPSVPVAVAATSSVGMATSSATAAATSMPAPEQANSIEPTDPRYGFPMSTHPELSASMAWAWDMPDPHTWSNVPAAPPQISGLPIPSRPMMVNRSSPSLTSEMPMQYASTLSPEASFNMSTWPVSNQNWSVANMNSRTDEADEEVERDDSHQSILWDSGHSPSYSQMLLARSVGRTPRLRYLISYFAEVIAPMIVAFDTPTNPFRIQMLHLAQDSPALQEAIATLATSNLRQRRERKHTSTERTLPARMSSMAHRALTEEAFQDRYGISVPEGYAREENHHRGMAVKALNADLADPQRRLSDSVLATLLVLSLFHGCDTGVAEFRTQFEGVTRLLAIRMRHSPVISDDLKWFIRMFSWFDTLTATTNDRDVQLRGKCLEISSITDGEWGLENLAGCDGRLFKLISQLGRLNLLSQDKQPTESRPADVSVPTASLPPNMVFPGWNTVDMDTTAGTQYAQGYEPSAGNMPPSSDQTGRPSSAAFWTEWYSLRQRLESWRFDPPSASQASFSSPAHAGSSTPWPSSSSFDPTAAPATMAVSPSYQVAPENLHDVYQISECFRHAALLYCERLAEPSLPSSHPRIQHLVRLAMHCLRTVESDVYLLWPLFIVGSECVQEDHRAAIRARCKDISKDSGFVNNLSCLELLEKIWADHSDESSYPVYAPGMGPPPPRDGSGRPASSQAFRWSRAMQAKRGDGEYMVV